MCTEMRPRKPFYSQNRKAKRGGKLRSRKSQPCVKTMGLENNERDLMVQQLYSERRISNHSVKLRFRKLITAIPWPT